MFVIPVNAWLSGYDYEKDIVITDNYTTTPLVNYPIKITLYNISGTDSGGNCYLDSHVYQTNWNDIRFITTTNDVSPMWIQETNSTSAVIWFRAGNLSYGENHFRLYYGNMIETPLSFGDSVFGLFSGYNGPILDPVKGYGVGNWSLYIDSDGNNIVEVIQNSTSGVSEVRSQPVYSSTIGYEMQAREKVTTVPATFSGFYVDNNTYAVFGTGDPPPVCPVKCRVFQARTKNSGSETITNLTTPTGWHIFDIKRDAQATSVIYSIDNTVVATHTTNVPGIPMPESFRSNEISGIIRADWMFVKQYVDPEPSITSYGTETVNGTPITDFTATPWFGTNGTTVQFTDKTTGPHNSWKWDVNGDGATDFTTKDCNKTYYSPGTINATLKTANANGETALTQPLLILSGEETPTTEPVQLNTTYIENNDTAYIPVEFYIMLIIIAFIFFFLSIMTRRSDYITGILAAVIFSMVALLTASVAFISVGFGQDTNNTTSYIIPVAYHPYIPYLSYLWILMFIVCVINIYRIWLRNLKKTATII